MEENKHGLNGKKIHFTPISDEKIRKNDIIGNDELEYRLFCRRKNVFIIITFDPENSYLTDEHLTLKFKIIDGSTNRRK